jgi:hypothetical protein
VEGKGREGKGREGKGREGKGRERKLDEKWPVSFAQFIRKFYDSPSSFRYWFIGITCRLEPHR